MMGAAVHIAPVTSRASRRSPGKTKKVSLCPRQRAIKNATRDLIEDVGGYLAAAAHSRLGSSQLQRCASKHHPDFLPIDVAFSLESIASKPFVTEALAREQNATLVALPEATGVTPAHLHAALGGAISEFTDVSTGLLERLGDGVVDEADADALDAECVEATEQLVRLRAMIRQAAGLA